MEHRLHWKMIRTLQNEGLRAVAQKAARRTRYALMRMRNPRVPGEERWQEVKDRFAGERVFLIGNGPSLNKMPLHMLRNDFTMSFNRFYLMLERLSWKPTFYMAVDDLVLDDLVPEVPSLLDSASLLFFPDIHFRGKRYDDRFGDHEKILWLKHRDYRGFSTSLPVVSMGGTVAYEGIQVLLHLGFREIYLIGMDMNFRIHETAARLGGDGTSIRSQADDDPNHFDPRYFGTTRKYHQPEPRIVEAIVSSMDHVASVAPAHGLRIFNAGVDSRLDCFERVEFRSLFSVSAETEDEWFNQTLARLSGYASCSEMLARTPEISGLIRDVEAQGDFTADLETGLAMIPSAVFTHVALGPHDNRYYFVRRGDRPCMPHW